MLEGSISASLFLSQQFPPTNKSVANKTFRAEFSIQVFSIWKIAFSGIILERDEEEEERETTKMNKKVSKMKMFRIINNF